MQLKKECRICKSVSINPAWQARDFRSVSTERFIYFQCASCRCLQIAEIPEDISAYYPEDYYSHKKVSDRKLFDPPWKGLIRRWASALGTSNRGLSTVLRKTFDFPQHHAWLRKANVSFKSRILDVGCGSGALLMRMWKEGFANTLGIDPFIKEDINYKNNLIIKKASLNDLTCDSSFDFIMMHHSLEHIPCQHSALIAISRLLRTEGTALIRIPVSTSYAWEHYRTDWVQLDAPRHHFLHSDKSLRILAKQSGLSLSETVYDSLDFQYYGSELCKRGVLMQEHKDYMKTEGERLFTKKQLKSWKKDAEVLNKNKMGDMACFYLSKV